jgi:predicted dehydrogenase
MNIDGHSRSPQSARPARVAVVGAGQFGELHARAYLANPNCELVAIVDQNLDRATAVAAQCGGIASYGSTEELLHHQRVDGVSVVTAGGNHLPPTIAALQAGASVLLEKPVVMSSAEGRMLAAAADLARGFVMPAHLLRFAQPYQELRRRVVRGEIGTPRALSFRRHRSIDHDGFFPDVHPVLMTMVHDIDLALWLGAGTALRVSARQLRLPGRSQPAVVWADVETDAGMLLSFQVSWSVPLGHIIPDAMEVIGDAGALALTLGRDPTGADPASTDEILTPANGTGALGEEIRVFVDALRAGYAPKVITLTEARSGIELAERIIASAESNVFA